MAVVMVMPVYVFSSNYQSGEFYADLRNSTPIYVVLYRLTAVHTDLMNFEAMYSFPRRFHGYSTPMYGILHRLRAGCTDLGLSTTVSRVSYAYVRNSIPIYGMLYRFFLHRFTDLRTDLRFATTVARVFYAGRAPPHHTNIIHSHFGTREI